MITGTLVFVLIVSAVLALPVSWFLLSLYRRAVVRTMRVHLGVAPGTGQGAGGEAPGSARSRLGSGGADALYRRTVGGWNRAAMAYAGGGSLFAALMATAFLVSTDTPMIATRWVVLWINYVWPAVLTVNFIAGSNRAWRMGVVAAYFAECLALWSLAAARNPDVTVASLAMLWLMTNVPATLLTSLFLWRRIRAVGPLVLAFMTAGIAGSNAIVSVADSRDGVLRLAVEVGAALGLNARGIFAGLILAGFVLFGVLGWMVLGFLAKRYEDKWFSDQSLTIDALWFYFGAVYAVGLTPAGLGWFATGLVAFGAFAAGYRLLFAALPAAEARLAHSPRLLLLRVFSLGRRSERLFDAFGGLWRRAGSTCMIAGPDLATTAVDPHEFLRFVSGRLSGLFINDASALDRRLSEIDDQPDFDGLHRVNEFFCYDNTWRLALQRLAGGSDAVLMDLRGYSPASAGCRYEIQELFNLVPLRRVVFVVDGTTDEAYLRTTLIEERAKLGAGSPNRAGRGGETRVIRMETGGEPDIQRLLREVTAAAASD